MKLSNVNEIKDISPKSPNENDINKITKEVNQYFKDGWKLLEIYKVDFGEPNKKSEMIHYIIGKAN